MTEVKSNFPPPAGMADEIIVKAIECLNADEWERETDTIIVIRGVWFWHEKSVSIPIHKDGSPILKEGKPSEAYGEAFKEAYKRAMARERDKRLAPLLKRVSSAAVNRRIRWTRGALRAAKLGLPVLLGAVLIGWAVTGVVSCAQQASVRADEINKYGYRYGAISSHKVWPDDCTSGGVYYPATGNSRDFTSTTDCKETWQQWEREGEIWVDWKLPQ